MRIRTLLAAVGLTAALAAPALPAQAADPCSPAWLTTASGTSYALLTGCGDAAAWQLTVVQPDAWAAADLDAVDLRLDVDGSAATGCDGYDVVVAGWYASGLAAGAWRTPSCDTATWTPAGAVGIDQPDGLTVSLAFRPGDLGLSSVGPWAASWRLSGAAGAQDLPGTPWPWATTTPTTPAPGTPAMLPTAAAPGPAAGTSPSTAGAAPAVPALPTLPVLPAGAAGPAPVVPIEPPGPAASVTNPPPLPAPAPSVPLAPSPAPIPRPPTPVTVVPPAPGGQHRAAPWLVLLDPVVTPGHGARVQLHAAPGAAVSLLAARAGAWRVVRRLLAGPDGTVTTLVVPAVSTWLRVGSGPPQLLSVRTAVSLRAVRIGRLVRLSGRVWPAQVGTAVAVRAGGTLLGRATTAADGSWAVTAPPAGGSQAVATAVRTGAVSAPVRLP